MVILYVYALISTPLLADFTSTGTFNNLKSCENSRFYVQNELKRINPQFNWIKSEAFYMNYGVK